jgi:riboflavin biosynthesis pyrimidine reductase
VRQLLPTTDADVDPMLAYADDRRRPVGERPWVLMNMIASLDGGTAVQGRSGALGGPADKAVFQAIRAVADLVLVAAGTVRAERYHAPAPPAPVVEARRARGQAPAPRLAIVSRRLELDESLPLFQPGQPRPIIVTTVDAPQERREDLAGRAEILTCGHSEVDLADALTILRARYSANVVLCEGGPSLNGALAELGLLDEVCLSVAPYAIGGDSRRIVHGAPPLLGAMTLAHVLEEDSYLFLRYLRDLG